MEKEIIFEPFEQQRIFIESVFSRQITTVIYGGSIRGGKSFAGFGVLLMLAKKYPGSRWAIIRKDLATIKRNLIPVWDKIKPSNFVKSFNQASMTVTFKNGSKFIFFAENYEKDKELNRFRGLEINGAFVDEINEIQQVTYFKILERVGSYVVPNLKEQPKPITIGTINPSYGWVKEFFYDKFKLGTLPKNISFIQASIFDNPFISQQYIENLKNLPKYEYEVFVLGNWDIKLKTGGEFLKNFELETHIKPVDYDNENTIHVSIDSNVLPYIAVSCWQIEKEDNRYIVKQIVEKPARDPINTARKAGNNVLNWFKEIRYNQKVFFYGDPTTKARNNIDDNKRSFYELFLEPIKKAGYEIEDRFFRKAPPVSATGDFINAILEGKIENIEIIISETCKESINDYTETKEDKNGGILKNRVTNPVTKQSYEPNGHMTDAFRYFICKAFEEEFNKFRNRFSDYSDNSLPEYEADLIKGF